MTSQATTQFIEFLISLAPESETPLLVRQKPILNDMGLLLDDVPFVHESIVGTTFKGRVLDRVAVGEKPAIVPEIEGSAWITGEHTFLIDGDDPLKAGFRL